MRRKPGTLLPLEIDILLAAAATGTGDPWLHGYALARVLRDASDGKRLTAHGTLYKALGRLADGGLLEQRWEDADEALAAGRPRRRLYRIAPLGQKTLAELPAPAPSLAADAAPRISPA